MTAPRMSARRSLRFGRRVAVALTVGAGVALTPLPALAGTVAPAPAYAHASGSAAQAAVNTALAQLGDRYAWAGAGPNSFDCSGLTQFAYQAAGISLPHSSRAQSTMGAPVSRGALQPGDLVFFYSPVSHVGIYIGNGQIVHARSAGDVVKITDLAHMPGFATARRLACRGVLRPPSGGRSTGSALRAGGVGDARPLGRLARLRVVVRHVGDVVGHPALRRTRLLCRIRPDPAGLRPLAGQGLVVVGPLVHAAVRAAGLGHRSTPSSESCSETCRVSGRAVS